MLFQFHFQNLNTDNINPIKMKKNIIKLIAPVVIALGFSCEKPLNTYEGKDSVYFNESRRFPAFSGEVLKDSSVISFSLVKAQDSLVNMIITTTGAKSTEDRPYKLVVNAASTAKEGVHYEILDKSFTIRKNKLMDTVRIKFLRKTDMQTANMLLSFDLLANESFDTEMKDKVINTTTGKKTSFVNYRWFVNDIIKKPGRWLDSYFGPFTRKKLLLMTTILNIEPAYLDISVSPGESLAYGKYMFRYLNEQKLAGNIILEDDGSVMVMGSGVQ
jgi:hypothetical protein